MGKRTARAIGQHHGDLKRKLIEVATDLVEAGDVDFSLRELARHAGVTAAAPYHHFASKTAVLDEVAIAGFAGLDRAIASAISKADTPTTKLTQMVVAYLHFANTHTAHYQLMFPRHLGADGDHRELRTVAELAFHRLLNAVRALRLHASEADLFFWAFSVGGLPRLSCNVPRRPHGC
jgi:AcrR family transcriptional regulator